jgi:hypothetical protein
MIAGLLDIAGAQGTAKGHWLWLEGFNEGAV